MPDKVAIQCSALGKRFRLYSKPRDRLLDSFLTLFNNRFTHKQARLSAEFWALRDISFSVFAGETIAIIGRNGSGKSTLLQLIAGVLNPTEGTVNINGRIAALLELGAGFHPEFSGLENAKISAAVLGLSAQEISQCLTDIISFADIGEFIHHPVKTYSSGMYVRLAFAISVHVNPDILIVDEALAVGDMAFQNKCIAHIRQFQQQGKTLLFVSHDINTVKALCHKTLYLEHGCLLEFGLTGKVTDRYLRDLHKEIQTDLTACIKPDNNHLPTLQNNITSDMATRYKAFLQSVQGQSHGTGAAHIRLVELLDEHDNPFDSIQFNKLVKVTIWLECVSSCSVSVNYKIRDKQLVAVVGADFLITGQPLLNMLAGQTYKIEYATNLALMHGDYSLRVSVTIPIAKHEQAVFVDVVEICCPFKLLPSPLGRIYTNAYLANSVAVTALNKS
ncbi:MAG: ABC transporter ATP-binding protein [Methylococcaceae bacterium]|jgi:lipopolysaccharide transport system ATP-binding protein